MLQAKLYIALQGLWLEMSRSYGGVGKSAKQERSVGSTAELIRLNVDWIDRYSLIHNMHFRTKGRNEEK